MDDDSQRQAVVYALIPYLFSLDVKLFWLNLAGAGVQLVFIFVFDRERAARIVVRREVVVTAQVFEADLIARHDRQ